MSGGNPTHWCAWHWCHQLQHDRKICHCNNQWCQCHTFVCMALMSPIATWQENQSQQQWVTSMSHIVCDIDVIHCQSVWHHNESDHHCHHHRNKESKLEQQALARNNLNCHGRQTHKIENKALWLTSTLFWSDPKLHDQIVLSAIASALNLAWLLMGLLRSLLFWHVIVDVVAWHFLSLFCCAHAICNGATTLFLFPWSPFSDWNHWQTSVQNGLSLSCPFLCLSFGDCPCVACSGSCKASLPHGGAHHRHNPCLCQWPLGCVWAWANHSCIPMA